MTTALQIDRTVPTVREGAPWVVRFRPRAEAWARLFCFPHAGGTAAEFRTWSRAITPHLELCAIQLPGSGTRHRETPLRSMQELVPPLAGALVPLLDRPFAFFGHSMGALVAFEVVHHLAQTPRALVVSAAAPPDWPRTGPPIADAPVAVVRARLRAIAGTPTAFLDDDDALALALPALRAGLAVCEGHRWEPRAPLDCPIVALAGADDPVVEARAVAGWQRHTAGRFTLRTFPGGHFYHRAAAPEILSTIETLLTGGVA